MTYSNLDMPQIIRQVYDESTDRLKVDSAISVTGAQIAVEITHTNDSIRLGDGTGFFTSTTDTGSKRALDVRPIGGTLVHEIHDYIAVAYPSGTSETYTYKTGGSGGTTVATVTVVYTDSTKVDITSVART